MEGKRLLQIVRIESKVLVTIMDNILLTSDLDIKYIVWLRIK